MRNEKKPGGGRGRAAANALDEGIDNDDKEEDMRQFKAEDEWTDEEGVLINN
jgi:hypothetical protein